MHARTILMRIGSDWENSSNIWRMTVGRFILVGWSKLLCSWNFSQVNEIEHYLSTYGFGTKPKNRSKIKILSPQKSNLSPKIPMRGENISAISSIWPAFFRDVCPNCSFFWPIGSTFYWPICLFCLVSCQIGSVRVSFWRLARATLVDGLLRSSFILCLVNVGSCNQNQYWTLDRPHWTLYA